MQTCILTVPLMDLNSFTVEISLSSITASYSLSHYLSHSLSHSLSHRRRRATSRESDYHVPNRRNHNPLSDLMSSLNSVSSDTTTALDSNKNAGEHNS